MIEVECFPHRFLTIPELIDGKKGKYALNEQIGQGGNGIVFQARDLSEGDDVAIKILTNSSRKRIARFLREIQILKEVNSPSIIRCIDDGHCDINVISGKKKFTTKFIFVVIELGKMNLFDYVISKPVISYEVYAGQFLALTEGLQELHSREIVHRDIKPENILVVGERWVLADFGLCSHCSSIKSTTDITEPEEMLGPRYWMSPEGSNRLVDKSIMPSYASDIYQLASVFWFVINRTIPVGIIDEGDWRVPERNFTKLILKALFHDSIKRPSDAKVLCDEIKKIIYAE